MVIMLPVAHLLNFTFIAYYGGVCAVHHSFLALSLKTLLICQKYKEIKLQAPQRINLV
jgi:hypothetical protein